MTRPAQPTPYPGDVGSNSSQRPPLRREYRDVLGRPLLGSVHLRNAQDQSTAIELVDGVLEATLEPGHYRLLAALHDEEGKGYYSSENITVGAYW